MRIRIFGCRVWSRMVLGVMEWSVVVGVEEGTSGHSTGIGNKRMTSVWLKGVRSNSRYPTRVEVVPPPQSIGKWPKVPDGTVDAFIYFRSTLAGGFKVGDVVAGHKVGLPISESCGATTSGTSAHAVRPQFPWVRHWM